MTQEKNKLNELQVPPSALEDPEGSHEILRAWVTGDDLEVSMSKVWDEPDNWGILLVDLARHAARIYEMEQDCSFDDAMDRIKNLFDAEWERSTDEGTTSAQDTEH